MSCQTYLENSGFGAVERQILELVAAVEVEDVDLCVVVEIPVVVVEVAVVVVVVVIVEAGTGFLEVEIGIDGLGVSMKVGGRMVDPMTVGLV